MKENKFMEAAIIEATKALIHEDVPIGAVIVYENEIIGRGYNQRNKENNALFHAEIIAINQACRYIQDWRLENMTIYVTIEPCPMCAGAILQARIPRLVFGANNQKAGCAGSIINMMKYPGFNHQVETSQLMERETGQLMSDFFRYLREKQS